MEKDWGEVPVQTGKLAKFHEHWANPLLGESPLRQINRGEIPSANLNGISWDRTHAFSWLVDIERGNLLVAFAGSAKLIARL